MEEFALRKAIRRRRVISNILRRRRLGALWPSGYDICMRHTVVLDERGCWAEEEAADYSALVSLFLEENMPARGRHGIFVAIN